MAQVKSEVHKALEKFDAKKGISRTALELARKRNLVVDSFSPAGRTLTIYHGLVEQIVKKVGKPRGKSFLDIAGATGILSRFLQERGARAVNFEFDRKLCEVSRAMGVREVVEGDALKKLPFREGEFDCVTTSRFVLGGYRGLDLFHSSGNYEGSEHVLKEVGRILKPNGVFIVNQVDARIPIPTLVELCSKYFGKVEPYAYGHEKTLIPGLVLSQPKKG